MSSTIFSWRFYRNQYWLWYHKQLFLHKDSYICWENDFLDEFWVLSKQSERFKIQNSPPRPQPWWGLGVSLYRQNLTGSEFQNLATISLSLNFVYSGTFTTLDDLPGVSTWPNTAIESSLPTNLAAKGDSLGDISHEPNSLSTFGIATSWSFLLLRTLVICSFIMIRFSSLQVYCEISFKMWLG